MKILSIIPCRQIRACEGECDVIGGWWYPSLTECSPSLVLCLVLLAELSKEDMAERLEFSITVKGCGTEGHVQSPKFLRSMVEVTIAGFQCELFPTSSGFLQIHASLHHSSDRAEHTFEITIRA